MKEHNVCVKTPNKSLGRWCKLRLGGHDTVRRVDCDGEAIHNIVQNVLVLSATKNGPQSMHRCKPEKMEQKDIERCWTRISTLEEGWVLAPNMRGWKVEGRKRRVAREGCKRLPEEFGVGGFLAQTGLWNIAKKRMLEGRGALPKADGDLLCEHQATHKENFLSRWLREDVKGKEERKRLNEEAKQEDSKSGNREVAGERERVENKRCLDRLRWRVLGILSVFRRVRLLCLRLCLV